MQTEELYDRYLFFLLSISQTRGQISHQTWSYACLHNVLKRTFEVFQSLYNKFGFVINQVTLFLHFQIIYSPLKLNIFKKFDRSSEKNIMEGLEIISTYFKEFNESLIGYVSQPSTWKQEFKGSCRNCNQSCLLFFFLLTILKTFPLFI